jgi:hypothetical protein
VLLDALGDVRWLALLAGSAAAFVVGVVWFAPAVLGSLWARSVADYSGTQADEVSRRAAEPAVLARWFLSVVVTAFTIEIAVQATGADGAWEGALLALLLGAGVGAAFFSWPVVFARLPVRWWLLNSGALVAMLVAMGAVLGSWP